MNPYILNSFVYICFTEFGYYNIYMFFSYVYICFTEFGYYNIYMFFFTMLVLKWCILAFDIYI